VKAHPVVRVGICADDFGMSREVDDAIADLAWHWRITATSCLVDGPVFEHDAPTLLLLRQCGMLDIGLHLNLTESFGEAAPRWSVAQLVARAFSHRLSHQAMRREVQRQFDRFQQVLGFAPDHVDGHQHVHQLPVVREALLQELERRPGARPWVRDSAPRHASFRGGLPIGERCRTAAIGLLGARGLRAQVAARGFGSNQRLLGVYSSDCNVHQYLERLQAWLAGARDGDLVMCHPAAPHSPEQLGVVGREAEYRVLASSVLPAVLAEHGVGMVRISELARPRIAEAG
jgi:chitin disaccharide deacetylase